MTVNDKIKEEASAKIIVSATGVNNFPSNPCKLSKGKNTITIIAMPAVTGAATSEAACKIKWGNDNS